jgi:hypothetical protein
MAWITRLLKLIGGLLALLLYVWVAAVRALPLVKARKRLRARRTRVATRRR